MNTSVVFRIPSSGKLNIVEIKRRLETWMKGIRMHAGRENLEVGYYRAFVEPLPTSLVRRDLSD